MRTSTEQLCPALPDSCKHSPSLPTKCYKFSWEGFLPHVFRVECCVLKSSLGEIFQVKSCRCKNIERNVKSCAYVNTYFFLLLWSLQWGIVTSTLGSTEHATQGGDWSAPGLRRREQEPAKHLKLAPVSTSGWGFLEASGNQQSPECCLASVLLPWGWVRAYEGLWMHREKAWFKVFHWLRLRQLPSSGRGFTASLHIARASPVAQGWRICRHILDWRILWTEESGGLQSLAPQRVGRDWSDLARMHAYFVKDFLLLVNYETILEHKVFEWWKVDTICINETGMGIPWWFRG